MPDDGWLDEDEQRNADESGGYSNQSYADADAAVKKFCND